MNIEWPSSPRWPPSWSSPGSTWPCSPGPGTAARFSDDAFRAPGPRSPPDAAGALDGASIVARVQPPTLEEVADLPDGVSLISFLQPVAAAETVRALAAKGATVYSLDLLPRISRAQSMDALSSQATVAGYRAGLSAAEHLAKFFPMFMTAAGTVPPAKVLVMGAGVAGLQAIATARRLGAVVRAYDVRAAAKEEVQSLGAKFVELDLETQDGAGGYAKEQSAEYLARQQELLAAEVAASDVVITTAQIPGRKAPVLVTTAMVERMVEGSVIVDMAADGGGNCELSVAGEDVATARRHRGGSDQSAGHHAHPRQLPLRQEHRQLSGVGGARGRTVPRLRRRDRGRDLCGAGRHGGARADRRGPRAHPPATNAPTDTPPADKPPDAEPVGPR